MDFRKEDKQLAERWSEPEHEPCLLSDVLWVVVANPLVALGDVRATYSILVQGPLAILHFVAQLVVCQEATLLRVFSCCATR